MTEQFEVTDAADRRLALSATGLLAELVVSGQVDQNTPYSIVERTPRVEEHHPASAP